MFCIMFLDAIHLHCSFKVETSCSRPDKMPMVDHEGIANMMTLEACMILHVNIMVNNMDHVQKHAHVHTLCLII